MIWVKALDGVLGYQQLTSLSSASSLTVPSGALRAYIACETQDVRFRDDGTNPTASVGQILPKAAAGANGMWYVGDLTKLKFIEVAASAKLNVTYYR